MKIRTKIITVFMPIVILSILSVAAAAVIPSNSAITLVAKNFFKFKVDTFKKEVIKQYELLVEGGVSENEKVISDTKNSVVSFAKNRLIEYRVSSDLNEPDVTDWLVFGFSDDNKVDFYTADFPFQISENEAEELRELIDQSTVADEFGNSSDRIPFTTNVFLGGEKRVLQGFNFSPFEVTYFLTVRESAYFSVVNMLIYLSGGILILFIVFAAMMTLILSSVLTRPIINISNSMEEIIRSGDLEQKVQIEYNDETGQLAHTFNIMTGELEKAHTQIKGYAYQAVLARNNEVKIRNIFQKYVPQELIDKFFENPESMLVGDNRKVAILFSDIRSFTTISENMKPDELVQSLNDYFTVMVDLVVDRKGVVDKYIGDAIMAFFGAPVAHDDDPLQSVLTALEMSDKVKIFNKKQVESGRPPFLIGVGVNYGEVTVGNIGTEKKMDYTVIGDTVNLASRLEGLTKEYRQEVIISEFLYFEVKRQIPCRMLDVVAVKGKSKGVRIYSPKKVLTALEAEGWKLHNKAMRLYLSQHFEQAVELFDQVGHLLPDDFPSTLMKERCLELKGKKLPENWDGVRVMKTK